MEKINEILNKLELHDFVSDLSQNDSEELILKIVKNKFELNSKVIDLNKINEGSIIYIFRSVGLNCGFYKATVVHLFAEVIFYVIDGESEIRDTSKDTTFYRNSIYPTKIILPKNLEQFKSMIELPCNLTELEFK